VSEWRRWVGCAGVHWFFVGLFSEVTDVPFPYTMIWTGPLLIGLYLLTGGDS
jgi:hypothetical protein